MYRGSIPQSSNIFWRRCAPLYITKLQDKALCRLNTRLQKEFTRENIKAKNIWEVGGACVEKQRISKAFRKVPKSTLRNFARCFLHGAKWPNFAPWRKSPCEIFARWNSPCEMVFPCLDAVVLWRPYLPHFSSKSYTVWSVGFLTSWDLKWYIACRKWTSESAPKVRKKTTAAVLCFLSLAKWLSLCLCSCFHLKFKPVNVQNPCFNLSK